MNTADPMTAKDRNIRNIAMSNWHSPSSESPAYPVPIEETVIRLTIPPTHQMNTPTNIPPTPGRIGPPDGKRSSSS